MLVKNRPHRSLPELCRIEGALAEQLEVAPCFVYVRPFTRCLLRTLSHRFRVVVYSDLPPKLLKHVVGLLQKDRQSISKWVSSHGEPKQLQQFWGFGGPSALDSVIVDHDPRTAALNCGNCVPILRYKGVSKDSTLLYLEKYLLDLALYEDVRGKLENDFGFGIQ